MSGSRSVAEPASTRRSNLLRAVGRPWRELRSRGDEKSRFASSGGEVLYGDVYEPAPETTRATPFSPYGISKWGGRRAVLAVFARARSKALRGGRWLLGTSRGRDRISMAKTGVVAMSPKNAGGNLRKTSEYQWRTGGAFFFIHSATKVMWATWPPTIIWRWK